MLKALRLTIFGNIRTFIVFLAIFIPTFLLVYGHQQAKQRQERQASIPDELQQLDAEAKAEVLRRKVEKEKTEPSTPSLELTGQASPIEGFQENTQPPSTENVADVERISSGPHKGMTLQESYAASRKERAEAKNAVRKHHEWHLQAKALDKKLIAASRKSRAIARAVLASADAELSAVLDVYALMSDEQLKYARQEALKTLPADKVERFFNDLANHKANDTTKTHEQISQDAKDILRSREARRIASREVDVEFEQIRQEIAEHNRNMPPDPFTQQP